MSKQATERRNWLEQVKEDAEKLTLRRLQDDGFESHEEKENTINAEESETAKAGAAKTAKK